MWLFCMYFLFRPILWFILLLVLVCLYSVGHYCSSWGYWVDWICDCCVVFFFVCPKVFFVFFRQTGKRDGPKYFFIEYYGLICKIILWRGPRIYIYIYMKNSFYCIWCTTRNSYNKIPNLMFSGHPLTIPF